MKFIKFLFTECIFLPVAIIAAVLLHLYSEGKYSEVIVITGGLIWLLIGFTFLKVIENDEK